MSVRATTSKAVVQKSMTARASRALSWLLLQEQLACSCSPLSALQKLWGRGRGVRSWGNYSWQCSWLAIPRLLCLHSFLMVQPVALNDPISVEHLLITINYNHDYWAASTWWSLKSSPWSSECLYELEETLVTAETSACRRGLSRALPSGLLLLIHRMMSLKTSSMLSSGSPDVNPCHIPGYNLNSLSTLAAVKKSSRLISGSVTRSSSPWSSRKGIVTCTPPNSHDFDN